MTTNDAVARMVDSGVVAVLRGAEPDSVLDIAEALYEGGVTAFEVTVDAPDAMAMITTLSEAFADHDDTIVGAGTVLDSETARSAITAGAEFVVGPTLEEDVVELCNRYGVAVAPGVLTPTEALRAYELGADVCKVFPAKSVGPGHLSGIKGPLPQIPLMPTGGVGQDNAGDYIEAGAACVGAGGALVPDEAVETEDWDDVTERAAAMVEAVADARE